MLHELVVNPEREAHELYNYLPDTSASLDLMLHSDSGMPMDFVIYNPDGTTTSLSRTSVSNIGLSIPVIVAQHDLGLKSFEVAETQLYRILTSLERMKKTNAFIDGLYSNWVTTHTKKPKAYKGFKPHFSSVDHAWLATGLEVGEYGFPALASKFRKLRNEIAFEKFHNKQANLLYGELNYPKAEPQEWLYRVATEARQAAYVGVQYGIPEGLLEEMIFNDMSWNGSIFERTMPLMFDDELLELHKDYMDIAMNDTKHTNGLWGKSPCLTPQGYKECGTQALALSKEIEDTSIISPYSSFQALPFGSVEAAQNLARMRELYPECYIPGYGFVDAIDTQTGEVVNGQLFVDQAMSFLPLYNVVTGNKLHKFMPETNAVIRKLHQNLELVGRTRGPQYLEQ